MSGIGGASPSHSRPVQNSRPQSDGPLSEKRAKLEESPVPQATLNHIGKEVLKSQLQHLQPEQLNTSHNATPSPPTYISIINKDFSKNCTELKRLLNSEASKFGEWEVAGLKFKHEGLHDFLEKPTKPLTEDDVKALNARLDLIKTLPDKDSKIDTLVDTIKEKIVQSSKKEKERFAPDTTTKSVDGSKSVYAKLKDAFGLEKGTVESLRSNAKRFLSGGRSLSKASHLRDSTKAAMQIYAIALKGGNDELKDFMLKAIMTNIRKEKKATGPPSKTELKDLESFLKPMVKDSIENGSPSLGPTKAKAIQLYYAEHLTNFKATKSEGKSESISQIQINVMRGLLDSEKAIETTGEVGLTEKETDIADRTAGVLKSLGDVAEPLKPFATLLSGTLTAVHSANDGELTTGIDEVLDLANAAGVPIVELTQDVKALKALAATRSKSGENDAAWKKECTLTSIKVVIGAIEAAALTGAVVATSPFATSVLAAVGSIKIGVAVGDILMHTFNATNAISQEGLEDYITSASFLKTSPPNDPTG